MTIFGDVRSASMGADLNALADAMKFYSDPSTPIEQMLIYVKNSLGLGRWLEMLVIDAQWCSEGSSAPWGDGEHETAALDAISQNESRPLTLLTCGMTHTWQDPTRSLQRAVLPIRRESVDRYWRPWADDRGYDQETQVLDHCLEVTQAWLDGDASDDDLDVARDAAGIALSATAGATHENVLRHVVYAATWRSVKDVAVHAARAAAWVNASSAPYSAVRASAWGAAWSDARRGYCNIVDAALIVEAGL